MLTQRCRGPYPGACRDTSGWPLPRARSDSFVSQPGTQEVPSKHWLDGRTWQTHELCRPPFKQGLAAHLQEYGELMVPVVRFFGDPRAGTRVRRVRHWGHKMSRGAASQGHAGTSFCSVLRAPYSLLSGLALQAHVLGLVASAQLSQGFLSVTFALEFPLALVETCQICPVLIFFFYICPILLLPISLHGSCFLVTLSCV